MILKFSTRSCALKCVLCLLIAVLVTGAMYAGNSEEELPVTESNFNPSVLDKYIEDQMKDCRIPGFSLGIVKGGETLYLKGYGSADNTKRAVTSQTPFLIASVSKTFTALAIMQLKEAGKLDLDAPVSIYLPGFSMADSRYKEITLRQILNHTAGFDEFAEYRVSSPQDMGGSIAELVDRYAGLHLSFAPGTSFRYSSAGYILLGEVISSVSGISYEEYIQRYIFDVLDMQHSYTSSSEAAKDGLAAGYMTVFGFPCVSGLQYETSRLPGYGIISCTEDLSHYAIMMMNGGEYMGKRLLSAEGIAEMTSPSTSVSRSIDYGLGWYVTSGSIYHGGELADYQAMVKLLPQDGIGIVFMYNTSASTALTLFNVGYRTKIETGIINAVYGYSPDDQPGQNPFDLNSYPMTLTYSLILALAVSVTLLLILSVYRLFTLRKRLERSRSGFLRIILISLLLNLLLPIFLIILVPNVGVSWPYVLHYIPDIGWFTLIYSGLLLLIGKMKTIIIIGYPGKKKAGIGKVWQNIWR